MLHPKDDNLAKECIRNEIQERLKRVPLEIKIGSHYARVLDYVIEDLNNNEAHWTYYVYPKDADMYLAVRKEPYPVLLKQKDKSHYYMLWIFLFGALVCLLLLAKNYLNNNGLLI